MSLHTDLPAIDVLLYLYTDDPVQQCIDYYNNVLVEHFDKNKNSDFISSYSELVPAMSGAMTVSTNSPEEEEDIPHVEDIIQGQVEPPFQADGDQFEPLNNEGRDKDYLFICEILEGENQCGHWISFNSCKSHVAEFHDIPKLDRVHCPWTSCGKSSYRRNLDRHIKTKHLGFKRLVGPPS